MEEVISNLIQLAQEYKTFFINLKIKQEYTHVRGPYVEDMFSKYKNGESISIYLNDNYTICSVYFGRLEIALYKNTIEIPFDTKKEDLNEIYKDHYKFLKNLKTNVVKDFEKYLKKEKLERINSLKKELDF